MRFEAFEHLAREAFGQIPEAYREGIDGLVVSREAQPHPERPDVFTLGECLTESYPSGFDSAETVRSLVVLYWGSFRRLAESDPAFDWEGELWETLTHELKHHLESLASDDGLGGVDYAMDQHFARLDGEPFDPWYYRSGEPAEEGGFRFEDQWFLESAWETTPPRTLHFEHGGRCWSVDVPERPADLHFLIVEGTPEQLSQVQIVLVRRRRWRERLGAALGRGEPTKGETIVTAQPCGDEP
ncbi:MAG: metallopeptidase family protein [Gemmatimonadota bacterium]